MGSMEIQLGNSLGWPEDRCVKALPHKLADFSWIAGIHVKSHTPAVLGWEEGGKVGELTGSWWGWWVS